MDASSAANAGDSSSTLVFGILPFVGLAMFLLVWGAFSINKDLLSEADGLEDEDDAENTKESPLIRIALPYIRAFGAIISRTRLFLGFRRRVRKRLIAAGRSDLMTGDEFVGSMIVASVVGALAGAVFWLLLERWGVPLVIAGMLLGFMMPFLGLVDAVRKRHHQIRRQLPFTLDLLTLSVESGLEFTASLVKIGGKMKAGPLRDEIKRLGREIGMGKSRSEALRSMGDRVQLEELNAVVSSLIQADELGSSLGPTLRIQADDLRLKRFQLAEKQAQRTPVLMLFPLVAFIFPLTFMITFAPMAIKFLYENPFADF